MTQPSIAPATFDVRAVVPGALTTLVLALVAGVVNQVLVDRGTIEEGSPLAFFFFLLIVLAGAVGGFVSGRRAPDSPLLHGAVASASAYLLVQGIGVIRRLIAGDPLNWLSYLYLAVLMATCGMLGALLANHRNRQEREHPGRTRKG
ncbi:MAG: hypothetical protein JJLCMIEE_01873 [Acidimicrobiales bacterium]|nr:hypothetical protein [Acidimicrobiales bacterium]RIK03671.1 MAG: TIGR04086 family membrane protein [Acidobacteriota bacterium]